MSKSVETDFNAIQFEKKLQALKDSQESINNCCHWCLENHQHHKKIVISWLNVLKRVRIEQRLTLFYLANDVIQYSKRRNYQFVESWSTTLQKATTMVRDEKIKHKILRIFKIWEQRNVYGEEFVTDLCGLISATPTARKNDEPQEFQSAYLITKIKGCAKLEQDTDLKLKKFKEHNPKMMDGEALCASLKDRAHVDDVEREMEEYIHHMEAYVNALKLEIKARHNLISLLQQAEQHLDKDKKDVKTVEKAYKVFALKVKEQKQRLEELIPHLSSPIPSPDIDAPSPSPDSDLDLPPTAESPKDSAGFVASLYQNPGFYNPVPPPSTESNTFVNNGFSSFMGSNMPFNIENINAMFGEQGSTTAQTTPGSNTHTTSTSPTFNTNNSLSSLFPSITRPPPPPDTPAPVGLPSGDFSYSSAQVPLMPPPMPPFCKGDLPYTTSSVYTDSYSESNQTYTNSPYDNDNSYSNPSYQQSGSYTSDYTTGLNYPPPPPPNVPNYPNDEYNPEEEPETWENEANWDQPGDMETPESPPMFEKEAFGEPIEYHDNQPMRGNAMDIDHRVLTIPGQPAGHRKKDVDHRNLISLTGSPKEGSTANVWPNHDQDFRANQQGRTDSDQDYRLPFAFDALKPPPPPPPQNQMPSPMRQSKKGISPRKSQDNVESIDMDLSDDDLSATNDNLKVLVDGLLEPPPPFPEFSEEADLNANDLLDDLSNELDGDELFSVFGQDLHDDDVGGPAWNGGALDGLDMMGPPVLPPIPWIGHPTGGNLDFNVRGRGNKRGIFMGRGDFRGGRGMMMMRGGNWRMRKQHNGNRFPRERGGRRPFFRGRFRGGY